MNFSVRYLLPIAFSFAVLSGCSNAPNLNDDASQKKAAAPTQTTQLQPLPKAVEVKPAPIQNLKTAHLDPRNPLYTDRSIYFGYDEYSVRKDYSATLERHAKYLTANPGLAIRIEGNADERGGTEYNLALGQKRAEAVVSAMRLYGVKDTQMEAISFGKEKPKSVGHDEQSWAQNRRADLSYLRKQ
jgi:peptidoglycan-associated lipoprotein